MPDLIPAPRVSPELTAAEYVALALEAHLKACPTCRNELCPTGAHLEAASRTDRSWIRAYPEGT